MTNEKQFNVTYVLDNGFKQRSMEVPASSMYTNENGVQMYKFNNMHHYEVVNVEEVSQSLLEAKRRYFNAYGTACEQERIIMRIATKIKELTNFQGHAALYHLSEPLKDYDGDYHEWVVVSSAHIPFDGGSETYIFPANSEGIVSAWDEMPGSIKGVYHHATALETAGYTATE